VHSIRDSPNLEGQVPVFISPRNSVAQLYTQALGSLPYFSAFDSDSPNLEDQVSVFISPKNWVAQLYIQILGSLYVTSYDSQG
jgi:hypothetical protein